jgi:ribonuclease E
MTPEEQDVYAWMGISPLVLANQELKNPKSAIISVVLPGEAPPPPEVVQREAVPQPRRVLPEIAAVAADEPDLDSPLVVEAEAPASAVDVEMTENGLGAESDEVPVNRRRRRRSSASNDTP